MLCLVVTDGTFLTFYIFMPHLKNVHAAVHATRLTVAAMKSS